MDKFMTEIARTMFQLVYLVDDSRIEQRWRGLQPSVRSQWQDKAETLNEVSYKHFLTKAREAVEGAGLTPEEIEDAKCDAVLSWADGGRGIAPRDIARFINSEESKQLMDKFITEAQTKANLKALGGE